MLSMKALSHPSNFLADMTVIMPKRRSGVQTAKNVSILALKCLGAIVCFPCLFVWCLCCFNPCGTKPRRHGIRCSKCELEMPSRARTMKHPRASRKPLSWEASTKSQRTRRSFLDLPREIRDEIYSSVLLAEGNVHLGTTTLDRWTPHHWHPDIRILERCWIGCHIAPRTLTPAVLAVSKQLHAEAAEVLYGHNTFSLDLALSTKLKKSWARRLVVRRLTLRDVLPLSPRYLPLIREVAFQPASTALGTDVPGFVEVISVLLADVPNAYFGFIKKRLGEVGAATYCSACQLGQERNVDAMDCYEPDGTLRDSYMVIPAKTLGFFAGWCPSAAARPAWAAHIATESVPLVGLSARAPINLRPMPTSFIGYLKTSSAQQVALREIPRTDLPNERTLELLSCSTAWLWYWNKEVADAV